MRKLKQRTPNDCFQTSVACILDIDQSELPGDPNAPTLIPESLREAEWKTWCEKTGFLLIPSTSPPPGLSVGVLVFEQEDEYNGKPWAHALVSRNGKVLWDVSPLQDSRDDKIRWWIRVVQATEFEREMEEVWIS